MNHHCWIVVAMHRFGRFGFLGVLAAFLCVGAVVRSDTSNAEFRPGPRVRRGFNPGPGANGAGLDLRDSVFVGIDLSNARFQGADLRGARFYQVRFFSGGASFRDADLRGAVFQQSPDGPIRHGLEKCDFTGAVINGLSFFEQRDHLSLSQIRSTKSFQEKDLSECQIVCGVSEDAPYDYKTLTIRPVSLDLRGFDLRRAVFVAGDLSACDFTDADITGATFVRSTVTMAQIKSTRLRIPAPEGDEFTGSAYAHPAVRNVPRDGCASLGFSTVDLTGWDFADADLRGTRFHCVDLTGVNFAGATVSGGQFWNSISREQLASTRSYQDGQLTEMVFLLQDFSKFDFARQNLTGTRFLNCDVRDADFTDAVITGADLRYLDYPVTPEQVKSTWNYTHSRMEGIRLPESIAKALAEESP